MADEDYGDGQGDEFDVEPAALEPVARQLLAAVMLGALADALNGEPDAIFFMDYEAPAVAEALGINPARVAGWREPGAVGMAARNHWPPRGRPAGRPTSWDFVNRPAR